jgi:ketosteroid isomerase-like protein
MTDAEQSIELARRAFNALAEGGVEAMLEYVHPEFEMETLPGIAAEPQRYEGHDGLRRWFSSFYEVMDEIIVEPRDMTALGPDRILIHFRMSARGQTSGIAVEQEARAVATLRDELLARLDYLMPEEPAPEPES